MLIELSDDEAVAAAVMLPMVAADRLAPSASYTAAPSSAMPGVSSERGSVHALLGSASAATAHFFLSAPPFLFQPPPLLVDPARLLSPLSLLLSLRLSRIRAFIASALFVVSTFGVIVAAHPPRNGVTARSTIVETLLVADARRARDVTSSEPA